MSAYVLVFVVLATVATMAAVRVLPDGRSLVRPASPALLIGCYLTPSVVLAVFLGWIATDPHASRIRFSLLGLGFRDVPAQGLAIGGDREQHDVWIHNAADTKRAATLMLGRSATGEIDAATIAIPSAVPSEVITVDAEMLGAVELQSGDRVLVGDHAWTWDGGGGFVGAAGTVRLPERRAAAPFLPFTLPVLRPRSGREATHPLVGLFPSGDRAGREIRSFFYREPLVPWGSDLFLEIRDADVRVVRNGADVDVRRSTPVTSDMRIHVNRAPAMLAGFQSGGIVDIRSFRALPGDNSLAIVWDTAEVFVTRWEDLQALRLPTDAKEVSRIALTFGQYDGPEKGVHFAKVGQQAEIESRALLDFDAAWSRTPWFGRLPLQVTSPTGGQVVHEGTPFWLGSKHLVALQIDRLAPPVVFGILAIVIAVAKVGVAQVARTTPFAAVCALVFECFVVLRIVLGYRCWAMDPFSVEAQELGLIAWALVPWSFLLVSVPATAFERSRTRSWRLAPIVAGVLFAFVWVVTVGHSSIAVWATLVAIAGLTPLMRAGAMRAPEVPRAVVEACSRGAARAEGVLRSLAARFPRPAVGMGWWPWSRVDVCRAAGWLAAAGAIFALRALFVVLGMKESVRAGGARVSLDLLHVPLLLVLAASYLHVVWWRIEREGRLTLSDVGLGIALTVVALVGPAFVVSDIGLVIVNIWPLLVAMTALAMGVVRDRVLDVRRDAWAMRGAAAIVAVLVVYGFLVGTSLGPRIALGLVSDATHVSLAYDQRTYLRLLQFAAPDRVAALGIRDSDEIAVVTEVMERYTAPSAIGRGLGGSEISAPVADTALRENAPGVLIAAEAGILGTLGMATLYSVLLAAGWSLMPWRRGHNRYHGFSDPRTSWFAILGGLALLTLAVPSLHMLAANYGSALFTGKNAYLLGLDSKADLIAVWTLVMVAGQGAAAVRDAQ